MRALVIATVLSSALGCGGTSGGAGGTTASGGVAVATVFPAARFVPAEPTYVMSARTLREGQAAFVASLEMFSVTSGIEMSQIGNELADYLGVDPTSAQALTSIGIDLDSSAVLFSEGVEPTFVVHLRSPDAMRGFLDSQLQRGIRTQSVIIDGVEVTTTKAGDSHISWAVDNEWMWVHFAGERAGDTEWFARSRKPTGTAWVDNWKWAQSLVADAPVVGAYDLQRMVSTIARHEQDARQCANMLLAVKRGGVAFAASGKEISARVSLDLGENAARVAGLLVAPPPGWAASSDGAPLSAQWNLDLRAAAEWVQACINSGSNDLTEPLDQYGIRTARAFAHSVDIDDKEGIGAVSADLSDPRFLRGMLDQIPGRSMAESSRTFGIYKGTHVRVPFVVEADYVLTDQLAIAAMGDNVLAKLGTGAAPAGPPPVMAIDVRPHGMPAGMWQDIFELLDIENPKRVVQRLQLWSQLFVGARIEGASLVLEARGIRR